MINVINELTKSDMKSNIARGLKLSEECGELAEAILSSEGVCGCGYKGKTNEDVLEEAVDVAIMAMSIFCGHADQNINVEKQFIDVLSLKLSKWREKIEVDK